MMTIVNDHSLFIRPLAKYEFWLFQRLLIIAIYIVIRGL